MLGSGHRGVLYGNDGAARRHNDHLADDGRTEDYSVLTIEGVAGLDPAPAGQPARLSAEERSAYVDRHREAVDSAGLTLEEAFTALSTVIRVEPTRVRAY